MTLPEYSEQLLTRGYVVFERAYSAADVDFLRSGLVAMHRDVGSPACFAREPKRLAPEVELCTTGLVFYKLMKHRPDYAPLIVREEVVEALRGALGESVELELTGAVIADASRPFFAWHTHIGGIDDAKYRRAGIWPKIDGPRRVMTLLYLDDIDGDDGGTLLVFPRKVGEPTPPPHDPYKEDWEGQIEVRVPRGSVVVMDECTWHAVRPKKGPGLRMFIGCYYRNHFAPPTEWVDESLRGFPAPTSIFASVLPKA